MKYNREYINSYNKKDFIEKLLDKYPNLKKSTAERRWYELKKKYGKKIFIKVDDGDITRKPNIIKIQEYKDMKRLNINITYELLRKHGFSKAEINWLAKHGVENG